MPARFVTIDRDTPLLLPPDLRQWIPEDHLAHYILDAVDALSLTQLRVNERGTGDEQYKADALVALCPMCQMNLDAFQGQMNGYFHTNYHMPILFFTQLMGVAFGEKPENLGFGSELVSAHAAMQRIGIQTPNRPRPSPWRRNQPACPCRPRACALVKKLLVSRRRVNERRREETQGTRWRVCLPLRYQYCRSGQRRRGQQVGQRQPGRRRGGH